jgi:hypothetical protein
MLWNAVIFAMKLLNSYLGNRHRIACASGPNLHDANPPPR